jgi:hypothetical protein
MIWIGPRQPGWQQAFAVKAESCARAQNEVVAGVAPPLRMSAACRLANLITGCCSCCGQG